MASCSSELSCLSCQTSTKYVCIQCSRAVCNRCSKYEENDERNGWKMGKSVGYCLDCTIFESENCTKDEVHKSERTANDSTDRGNASERLV